MSPMDRSIMFLGVQELCLLFTFPLISGMEGEYGTLFFLSTENCVKDFSRSFLLFLKEFR